ncbi:MAG: hypothetical protein LBK40_06205 [Spirochaetaceae bacterium]|jgi:hypothetical protein|nr:hypothetical protein [Spirochaetaceae bacterium]
MAVPKIYLETTMFSFYYEERTAPPYRELKTQVRRIFDLIKAGEYEPYTSPHTTREIDDEPNEKKRGKMWGLIPEYAIKILDITDEVKRLANLYIREKTISPLHLTDAAHIAISVVNGLDYIVSLNFSHIVRAWTIEHVRQVNAREDYKGIGIYRPMEVLEIYENDSGLHE